jgi:hypothetical protein
MMLIENGNIVTSGIGTCGGFFPTNFDVGGNYGSGWGWCWVGVM